MNKAARIYVAGHTGLVGGAICRKLKALGFANIVTATRGHLDLENQLAVQDFFRRETPEYVFLAAAKVGGIYANQTQPYDFLLKNLLIESNVINSAAQFGVRKLLFLGSSCIYPKNSPVPIKESELMQGPLEETNEAYALAKIAGIRLCQGRRRQYGDDFISAMPTNMYGPGDNYDLATSHVLPALLRKFHEAKVGGNKEVEVWGSGRPRREFLYVDDCADACIFLMMHYSEEEPVNIGTGTDITISQLCESVARVVGCHASIRFDSSRPDGVMRKTLDVSKLHRLGWEARTSLDLGLSRTYEDFASHISDYL